MEAPKNYKWSWSIDQRAIVESGLQIDIIDFSILRMLIDFASSTGCKKMNEEGVLFYMFRWKLVKDQFPTLKLNTRQSVKKRLKKLIDAKLIAPHPENQRTRSAWFRFAENRKILFEKNCKPKLPTVNQSYPNTSNQSLQCDNESLQTLATKVTLTSNQSLHDNTINNKDNNNSIGENAKIKDLERELKELKESRSSQQPKKKRKVFIAPTLEAAKVFFKEKESTEQEAEKFWYFYESKGWMVGKNKMQKWRASAGQWIGRNKPKVKQVAKVDQISEVEQKTMFDLFCKHYRQIFEKRYIAKMSYDMAVLKVENDIEKLEPNPLTDDTYTSIMIGLKKTSPNLYSKAYNDYKKL
jgi:hypothetical protein